ncbi:FecCD family ABC transporter permease [Couchioplanes caeruleus]|uniref:Iron ABC transporter permease n=2 Tax=Couchioplanes caeruleus TaxID=56438 RepID=A0A1K0H2V6_9ACTN|nr:iron ABC transporter permease [Couchioplanes caeruleus]OJF16035.1 iron ABC transporter permease [Couchioplanes caeruleus subsp. caeruleus]ROP27892.1 iron complex transport system permease protein [Couchioplanes caeruleus]
MGSRARRMSVILVALALLALAVLASLALGSKPIPVGDVLSALRDGDGGEHATIVRGMRVPRTLVGLEVGAALALAGVAMQALTRNPLADPRILGVSAGAAAGVVTAIAVFGITTLTGYVWFGLVGAAVAGVLVYAVTGRAGVSPVNVALAGAAVDASLGALIYGLLAVDARTFDEYRFWAVGALAGRTPDMAAQVLPFVMAGLLLAVVAARGLDALALGDDVARGLGFRVGRVRLAAAGAAVLLTGAAVAVAGPIAFVGLAVPHLARGLVGADHRWVVAVSVLLGPALVLAADVVGRVITPPGEVPTGVVTALVGAPLLVVLVHRARAVSA